MEGNPVSYTDPFGLSPYTYANALGRLNGVVQGIGNMLSNVNWSTVLHAGLDILGSLPGGSVFNIANAALYGLEGNKEEAIKSLIYAIQGADLLGKATNYAVKGGKYAKEVLAITELATYAGYEMSAMLAAGDFGNDIAGMIDKYMTGEADLSIETAEELLSLFGHAFQLNGFSSGFINVPQADFSVIPEGKYEVKFADTDPMVMDEALGVQRIEGGKKAISYTDYDNIYQSSIHNAGKDKVMLGKYDGGGATSYITKAGNDYTYFSLGNEWNTIKTKYGYSDDDMFKLFNEAFLDDGINAGKTFQFSHDPINDTGALGQEYKYLLNNNYRWDAATMTMKPRY